LTECDTLRRGVGTMFDSLAIPADARRRFGAPAAVSLTLHLVVVGLVPAMSRYHATAAATPEGVFVLLQPRRPAPAAAPLGQAPAAKPPKPKRKPVRRPPVAVVALVPPVALPAAAPPPEAERPAPVAPPATGQGAGSSVGAVLATNADGNVEYDDALMTPPERISGPDPEYTYLARIHDVQGLMLVKCVVTVLGIVRDCRVIQGLAYMDGAVVDALVRRRYTPARLADGRAIEVEYTFRIRLQLVR
jgi:protein TonB